MHDPFATLGLPPNSDDRLIRRRYLELVRRHPPERDPERFAQIQQAYDKLRDPAARLEYILFDAGKDDSIVAIIQDVSRQTGRRRMPASELLQLGLKHL